MKIWSYCTYVSGTLLPFTENRAYTFGYRSVARDPNFCLRHLCIYIRGQLVIQANEIDRVKKFYFFSPNIKLISTCNE